MKTVVSRLDVRPVGQGAFIRGQAEIYFAPYWADRKIRWIYDCGTDSRGEIIDASVFDIGDGWPSGETLDFLIISHFDRDHICGLPTLLSRYKFDRILMPHLPRLVRLLAVVHRIEQEAPARLIELLAFADDPVAFIRTRGGESAQIIFVEAPEDPEARAPLEPNIGDRAPDPTSPLSAEELNEQTRIASESVGAIRTIASGRALVWDEAWELVPYVDYEVRKLLLSFEQKDKDNLAQILEKIVALATSLASKEADKKGDHDDSEDDESKAEADDKMALNKDLKKAIKNLKQAVYDAIECKLGNKPTAKHKNAISLMSYMGPVTAQGSFTHIKVGVGHEYDDTDSRDHAGRTADGCGWLLTGDADLMDSAAVDRLVAHMTPNRIQTLGVLQVPHHGSKHNSSHYTAQKLAAPFNVINANPHGRHGHPDSEVVDLFTSHTPTKGTIAPALVLLANARAFEAVSVASDTALWTHSGLWITEVMSYW